MLDMDRNDLLDFDEIKVPITGMQFDEAAQLYDLFRMHDQNDPKEYLDIDEFRAVYQMEYEDALPEAFEALSPYYNPSQPENLDGNINGWNWLEYKK